MPIGVIFAFLFDYLLRSSSSMNHLRFSQLVKDELSSMFLQDHIIQTECLNDNGLKPSDAIL
jgi:hypothetical protein